MADHLQLSKYDETLQCYLLNVRPHHQVCVDEDTKVTYLRQRVIQNTIVRQCGSLELLLMSAFRTPSGFSFDAFNSSLFNLIQIVSSLVHSAIDDVSVLTSPRLHKPLTLSVVGL